jgi:hypothetical protein
MTFQGMADKFVFDPFRRVFCSGVCHFTPRDCTDRQKIIICDWPMLEYGQHTGMLVNTMLKLSFQRDWLRRQPKGGEPLTFLWADEMQYFLTPGIGGPSKDNLFQQSCRESRIVPVYITQNILNISEALGEHIPGSRTKAFLGNIMLKVFLQQNEVETNRYAAQLVGQEYRTLSGTNVSLQGASFSESEQLLYRIDPHEFTALQKPSEDDFACEAIIYQGGKPFMATCDKNGVPLNYLKIRIAGA